MSRVLTQQNVADIFNIPVEDVPRYARKHGWPVIRLSNKVLRFREEDIAAIVAGKPASAK